MFVLFEILIEIVNVDESYFKLRFLLGTVVYQKGNWDNQFCF